MWPAVLTLAFVVSLTAPFGDAEASALVVSDDGSAVLEVSVEVFGSPAAVLVRGVGPVDELPPVALAPRGDGTYGGLVELTTTAGVRLGFEFIPAGGGAAVLTELFTLVELGVDPAALAGVTPAAPDLGTAVTEVPESASEGSFPWAFLATGAGAAFIALLGLWIWMGRRDPVDQLSGNADDSMNADGEYSTDAEL